MGFSNVMDDCIAVCEIPGTRSIRGDATQRNVMIYDPVILRFAYLNDSIRYVNALVVYMA
jgi:hypothetical protein